MNPVRINILKLVGAGCVVVFVVIFAILPKQTRSWEELIARPGLTEMEFTRLYARALQERFPDLNIKVVGALDVLVTGTKDGTEIRGWLGNMWKECADRPLSRVTVCKEHIEALAQQMSFFDLPPLPDDMNSILAKIEPSDYLDGMGLNEDGSKPYVARHLAADIWVTYVRDCEGGMVFLDPNALALLNLSMDELEALAISNLRKRFRKVTAEEYEGGVYAIAADGTYDASLVLFDELWEGREDMVDGDVVVAMPCRGLLLMTGSDSVEGIKKMRLVAEEMYDKEAYPISKTLFVRTDGKWQAYKQK